MRNILTRSLAVATAATISITAAGSAFAATIGVAVDAIGSSTTVGTTVVNPGGLTGTAIEYFIPLTTPGTCTYGVDCGTSSDTGSGGTAMSMFLKFTPIDTLTPAKLVVDFDDLDLIGAADTVSFFETFQVYNSLGGALTSLITDITDPGMSGNTSTQQFNLDLGLISDPFWLEFVFTSASRTSGTNTPEYLIATIVPSPVPLPAALPLFFSALTGLGVVGWRRRRKTA
jgi:hypothetical protein